MATKRIRWYGTSREDLIQFPTDVKRDAGFELDKVQNGREPVNWKPIPQWGTGVVEIRLHGEDGAFRVVYVAKIGDEICVLHSFNKKTQATSPKDVDIIKKRYKQAVADAAAAGIEAKRRKTE